MSLETDLYTKLTAYTALTALVGTRFYPAILPDDVVYPAICYSVISKSVIGSGASNNCMEARVQLSAYAVDYLNGVIAIEAQIINFAQANGYRFEVAGDVWEQDSTLYHRAVDLFITHSQ